MTISHTFDFESAMKVFHTFENLTFQSSNDKWLQCAYYAVSLSPVVQLQWQQQRQNKRCQSAQMRPTEHECNLDGPNNE